QIDEPAARVLLSKCRRQAPSCTITEIQHFACECFARPRVRSIDNPSGFLIDVVPNYFAGNYRANLPPVLLTNHPKPKPMPERYLDQVLREEQEKQRPKVALSNPGGIEANREII